MPYALERYQSVIILVLGLLVEYVFRIGVGLVDAICLYSLVSCRSHLFLGDGTRGVSSCSIFLINAFIASVDLLKSVSTYASLFPSIFLKPRCSTSFLPSGVAAIAYHFFISCCLSNDAAHLMALLIMKCPLLLSFCLFPV